MDWVLVMRVIEKLLALYFLAYLGIDFLLFLYSLFVFRKKKSLKLKNELNYAENGISIVVPGYNEEVTIAECLRVLLTLEYPEYGLVFVNDGSGDQTLEKVKEAFELVEVELPPLNERKNWIETKEIKGIWKTKDSRLMVIDKENGGKADSVNAGINLSTRKFVCTVDADSILDPTALQSVVEPMILDESTFVSGGQLAAANDVQLINNKIESRKMPKNLWVLWQILEYIKSFMISKIGLSKIDALLIMSGAFSLYRKTDLLAVGGFLTKHNCSPYLKETVGLGHHTVCEDMEIVVRLWRYYRDRKVKGKAIFMPSPVCWTEVPENGKSLFRQRSRWHLGLAESLVLHRDMIFEPRYGMTAMFALPYYFLFELLSPLVKVFTLVYLITASWLEILDGRFVVLMVVGVLLLAATFTGLITVFIEMWSRAQVGSNRAALRYGGFMDWIWLLFVGILGDFSYSFFKVGAQVKGLVDFMRGRSEWNKFERKGFSLDAKDK